MLDPRIFVSYARSDGFEVGRALSDRLSRDHGFRVWRDLAHLEGGGDWWRQITEAIDRVEYLVLVMTPAALNSHVVRDEWRYARQRGVCVVPVIGVVALDFSELPEWMRRTHFVDPRDPEQWTRFVRTLENPCRTTRVPMVELFDTITRRDIWTMPCPDDYPVVQVVLTPDARYVAALAGYWMERQGADAVHVWQVESKREVFAVARGGIQTLVISPDAGRVIMQLCSGVVEVWSVASGERIARWECGEIAAMAHGVESGDLVVASTQGAVNVWTVGQDHPRTTIGGSREHAIATAVTQDARTIARAFADGRLECHRLAGDQLQSNTLRPPGSNRDEAIRKLVITAAGQKLISSESGAVRLWNLGAPAADVRTAEERESILSMTPDGQRHIVQAGDGTVACRDETTGEIVTLEGLIAPDDSPDITPDGEWAVYQGPDGRRNIWDTSTGAHVVSLTDPRGAPVITCDSRVVYLRRNAEERGPWVLPLKPRVRLEAARLIRFEDIDPRDTVALAVVPGSTRVVILTTTGAFSWHLDDPAPRRVLERDGWWFASQNSLWSLSAARANERWLFACSWQQAEVWDMHSGSKVLDLDLDAGISTAAFTASGRCLLIAADRFVTLLDIERGLTVARFHADATIRAVACPSDTAFIAASSDGRVHRLDLRNERVATAAMPG